MNIKFLLPALVVMIGLTNNSVASDIDEEASYQRHLRAVTILHKKQILRDGVSLNYFDQYCGQENSVVILLGTHLEDRLIYKDIWNKKNDRYAGFYKLQAYLVDLDTENIQYSNVHHAIVSAFWLTTGLKYKKSSLVYDLNTLSTCPVIINSSYYTGKAPGWGEDYDRNKWKVNRMEFSFTQNYLDSK